ncbi:unnamed protein product [Allacma fusca]|uniref:Uncharacterized protein n=1 Tax=Allacma fusca TaxID=39272 RepID=A0A8J2P3H7_9HEXA|nr:unnamed protein product [Allacma fusca]
MIVLIFEYRKPFEVVLRDSQVLRKYTLNKTEWELIQEIILFLKPFCDVTMQLSKSKIPSMALTASVYIALYKHLVSFETGNCSADIVLLKLHVKS